jgi:hypothetical protein
VERVEVTATRTSFLNISRKLEDLQVRPAFADRRNLEAWSSTDLPESQEN